MIKFQDLPGLARLPHGPLELFRVARRDRLQDGFGVRVPVAIHGEFRGGLDREEKLKLQTGQDSSKKNNLQFLHGGKHGVQGGPSASGKIYVDIKFKVPSLA